MKKVLDIFTYSEYNIPNTNEDTQMDRYYIHCPKHKNNGFKDSEICYLKPCPNFNTCYVAHNFYFKHGYELEIKKGKPRGRHAKRNKS